MSALDELEYVIDGSFSGTEDATRDVEVECARKMATGAQVEDIASELRAMRPELASKADTCDLRATMAEYFRQQQIRDREREETAAKHADMYNKQMATLSMTTSNFNN